MQIIKRDGTGVKGRRRYSDEFKAQIVAQCRRQPRSVMAVSREHGLNHLMVRRWISLSPVSESFVQLPVLCAPGSAFIELECQTRNAKVSVRIPCEQAQVLERFLTGLVR